MTAPKPKVSGVRRMHQRSGGPRVAKTPSEDMTVAFGLKALKLLTEGFKLSKPAHNFKN